MPDHRAPTESAPLPAEVRAEAFRARLRERLRARRLAGEAPAPAPRYDAVYEQGQRWLDDLAAPPPPPPTPQPPTPPKPKRRLFLLLAPLACLLCPAHLLGYAVGALGLARWFQAPLEAGPHSWLADAVWVAFGLFVAMVLIAWERRHHAHHRCQHAEHTERHVHQHDIQAGGDIAAGDILKE